MVDLGYSAAYPSNDGLVVANSGGVSVATGNLFTRADWQKISPSTIVAGQFSGRYFFSYEYSELDGTIYSGTAIIDLTGQQPFLLRAPWKAQAFHFDIPSGQLFYLVGRNVYEFDALGEVNEIMTWRSKRVVLDAPAAFGAILIEALDELTDEQKAAIAAAKAQAAIDNAALYAQASMGSELDGSAMAELVFSGDNLQKIAEDEVIAVSIYAGGNLIATISNTDDVKRFPCPRKERVWEIQVNGSRPLEQITLATSARELNEI